jgi:hypothetical protein
VAAADGGNTEDAELERLQRQYPQWRIWRGRTTGHYWAMPPRGHPTIHGLINAADIGDLADRLARRSDGMTGKPSARRQDLARDPP